MHTKIKFYYQWIERR